MLDTLEVMELLVPFLDDELMELRFVEGADIGFAGSWAFDPRYKSDCSLDLRVEIRNGAVGRGYRVEHHFCIVGVAISIVVIIVVVSGAATAGDAEITTPSDGVAVGGGAADVVEA
ncbi:hypothetical protein PMKS-002901 [Pichia membranifaciens]|uniref:Uncharacterized protein n=1 Tax=Pichia membranifaciens TaxID=4926 RepID=A0A1Q2YIU9_9ASCO|nr:hypothetical protein PMKS-002901 [Pichia membranifaciens]